jgi:hypothetical protein
MFPPDAHCGRFMPVDNLMSGQNVREKGQNVKNMFDFDWRVKRVI